MTTIKEKDFIRRFILELILVQKESVFYLWDEEEVLLPNNYMKIFDEIMSDDVKNIKYSNLIPSQNREEWKCNINQELNGFLTSSGVNYSYDNKNLRIKLNEHAISKILYDKRLSDKEKVQISFLAEDFLITKSKTKPKQKTLV